MVPSGKNRLSLSGVAAKPRKSTKEGRPAAADLVIVGGGINGAALARLAALRGQKVVLFEAGDFGQGASSNTSKLLHGGLRYLESYAFGLVRESVRERARWLALAPHLTREVRFHYPLVPQGRHGRLLVKCGMLLYDGLAGNQHLSRHAWVSAKTLADREPALLPGSVRGAYAYADCVMDDARHCLETLLDAEALGADIANYHRVTEITEESEGVDVAAIDRLTGRECVVRAAKVAVLAGPWTDQFLRGSLGRRENWVRRSQGIHLVVDGLPVGEHLILPVPNSPRYFFVLPGEGSALVGTTETEIAGDLPESPLPLQTEIDELLGLLRLYFPSARPRVLGVFAGVRPLAKSSPGETATVSREHVLHRISDRITCAVGGKYTTHRPLAIAVFHHVMGRRHGPEVKSSRAAEAAEAPYMARPLPGAWSTPAEREALLAELAIAGVPAALAAAWSRRYGLMARRVLPFAQAEHFALLPGCADVAVGEVDYALQHEHMRTPIDFFRRRTRLFFTPHAGLEALPEVEARLAASFPEAKGMLGSAYDYVGYLRDFRHVALKEKP